MTQKFIDKDGLKVLWNQISLQDYPNNETLMAVIDAIDETKADKSEIVQADWNQTDENRLDYIKNRPFGEETVLETLLEETTLTKLDNGMFGTLVDFQLVKDETYVITWQGVDYECVAFEANFQGENGIGVGNKMAIGGEDSGEPFILGVGENDGLYLLGIDVTGSLSEVTVSIRQNKENIQHIDPKYIKDMYYSKEEERILCSLQEVAVGTSTSPEMFERIGFEIGRIYTVLWNGITYECEAYQATMQGMSGIGVGNKAAIGGSDTGEPFIIADIIGADYGAIIDLTASESTTAIVSISSIYEEISCINPKYIKDMYYTEQEGYSEEILPSITLTTDTYDAGVFTSEGLIGLIEGKTYLLNWNGTEYIAIAKKVSMNGTTAIVLGNSDVMMETGDTGEPYIVADVPSDNMYMCIDIAGLMSGEGALLELTLSITYFVEEILHKIHPKYVEGMYYTEEKVREKVVIAERVIDTWMDDSSDYYAATTDITDCIFTKGNLYKVIWNEVEYEVTAKEKIDEYGTYTYLGNSSFGFGGDPNTQEPFLIVHSTEIGGVLVCSTTNSNVIFSVYEISKTEKIHKVDSKYIDAEWMATSKLGKGDNILYTKTIANPSSSGEVITNFKANLIDGEYYTLQENEETHIAQLKTVVINSNGESNTFLCLGNISLFTDSPLAIPGGGDTGESFGFVILPSLGMIAMYTTKKDISNGVTLTISDTKLTPNKLPEKFLPDNLAKKGDALSEFKNDLYGEQEATEVLIESQIATSNLISEGDFTGNIAIFSTHLSKEQTKQYSTQKHIITIDGVKYETTARLIKETSDDVLYSIGNAEIYPIVETTTTNEPFYILVSHMDGASILFDDDKTSHTIEIIVYTGETEIKKIPAEYLEVDTTAIPTKVSELENDSGYLTSIPSEYITDAELNSKGYLTSYTETDPTVPAWAKEANKPTYTADEVGARSNTWLPTLDEIGAESKGTAENTVSTHNISVEAHADIRNELTEHINNERVHITNHIILTDIANGYDYFVFMENGILTSSMKINRIKVVTPPDKVDYSDTDTFDPTGMVIVAVLQDGSEREITNYTHSQWVEIGTTEFEISYEEYGNVYTTTIPITTRTLEQALVDFEYTMNEDGTYTITSWKETLNGEPSTKCAIPNSRLINL